MNTPLPDTSTAASSSSPPPSVIPTGNVVVVREDELDTDLSTAIERIRSNDETSRSRILIVKSDTELRDGHATDRDAAVVAMPVGVAQLARMRERGVVEELGTRYELFADCLSMFVEEAEQLSQQLVDEAIEAPRARIHGDTKRLGDVLAWTREVVEDLRQEVDRSKIGMRALELAEPVREAASQVAAIYPAVTTEIDTDAAGEGISVFARNADLLEALFLAISLTAHRIDRCGRIRVSVKQTGAQVSIEVLGYGEPKQIAAPTEVQRFRAIIDAHGGTVTPPVAMGPSSTGIVVTLPLAPRAGAGRRDR